ncbi:MAG: hypothetical protein Q7R40_08585 [Phaeospirillum sp.]|nr:hypothetical protein [Phaeospirillum sp.]
MTRTPLSLLLAAALLLPFGAVGQTVGGKVPPYQAPAKVAPPARDGQDADVNFDKTARPDPFKPREDLVQQFSAAYAKGGRPRLAFYWNRQLTDTLAQWYSDSRTITSSKTANATEGDLTLKQSGSSQNTVETQRRATTESTRGQPAETWEWEFQDGFLAPFLQADAIVVDRTAIMRIMGAGAEEIEPRTVEVMALQNMADLLVEVLVSDSAKATTGYELRARILDVRTGRILAMVNSRGLREWQQQEKVTATSRGFDLPDEDDETFGPERADQRYKATASGFERKRKPPKLNAIAGNLAHNVMTGMIPRLESGPAAAPPATPVTRAAPAPTTSAPMPLPPPKPTVEAKAAPSQSAVPLPDVDATPLPAPTKTTPVPEAPAGEEPPMPRPTKQ